VQRIPFIFFGEPKTLYDHGAESFLEKHSRISNNPD